MFLEEVHLRTVESEHFLEVAQCLNGTGGCGQEFHKWSPGELRNVTQSITKQIRSHVPYGYQISKGARIDLGAMAGEVGLTGIGPELLSISTDEIQPVLDARWVHHH